MLVLGRKQGETIVMYAAAERIVVSLERATGPNGVRIGVEAGPSVEIIRGELERKAD